MDLYFITDSRFGKNSGKIYNLNGSLGDTLWERYLEHFDRIIVIARVLQNAPANQTAPQTTDPRVSFVEIPYFVGPFQYIKLNKRIRKIIYTNIRGGAAYICRLPGTLGNIAVSELRKKKIEYAIEVVGDPKDSLSYTATHKIIPAIISHFSAKQLKKNVYNASAALYVTNETLQKRYPVNQRAFSIGVSDVVIDTKLSYSDVKSFPTSGTLNLLAIGSLEQMYKSPDIVLKALSIVKSRGVDFRLTWLGDGKYKNDMIKMSEKFSISENVFFQGNVSKEKVNQYLRNADIYIQASRTEGLPRALVEAMAVGLPCIGTNVGGIPELLNANFLIEVNNFKMLSSIICQFASYPSSAEFAKKENFEKAKEFNPSDLKIKRNLFYNAVKLLYNEQSDSSPKQY